MLFRSLPPGYMKSMLISIMYVAWRLGVDPSAKFVCISYGDDLAHKHSASTRKLMQSQRYRQIFPGTKLDKKAEDHLTTTRGGYRYATAVLSDITGFRPNEIIVDDPIEPKDANSEPVKLNLRNWIADSVLTRFESNARNLFVLVMHRVAPDDLSGTLQQKDGYFCLSLPLVAEKQERFLIEGDKLILRETGDYLNPRRLVPAQLEILKNDISSHAFASQYQQRPTTGGSGMCTIERLARYDTVPKFALTIHSWDIGATVTGNASVCTKWGVVPDDKGIDRLYLSDVIRIKLELPDVRASIKMQDSLDKPDLIIIDHRGVGLGVYQDLRREGCRHIYGASASGDTNERKIERFGKSLLLMYDQKVLFPAAAPFIDAVMYDLASFPDLRELDLVDSITQLLAHLPRALTLARSKLRPN